MNIKERLDNLESMLTSMVPSASPVEHLGQSAASSNTKVSASYQKYELSVMSASTQSSQEDHILPPELPHRHETGDGQVSYVDPSHWMAILDEIKEVREHLSAFDRPLLQEEPQHKGYELEEESGFLFGAFPAVDLEDVLVDLPPRQTCDALISQYFNSGFMASGNVADRSPIWTFYAYLRD